MNEQELKETVSRTVETLFDDTDQPLSPDQRSKLLSKTMELHRRSVKLYRACSEQTRVLACLHLGARTLGLSCRIDMMVQRLTSVNKGEIYEVVRTLISVLDLQLEDEVDVKSLCVQFGCTSMQPQVESFVQLVRKQVFKQKLPVAGLLAAFAIICSTMKIKRIDVKRLVNLGAPCTMRDFKKARMYIEKDESCKQFLLGLTCSQAGDPQREQNGRNSSNTNANSSPAEKEQPKTHHTTGIHSMVTFRGWENQPKYKEFCAWRSAMLKDLRSRVPLAQSLSSKQLHLNSHPYIPI